MKKAIILLAFFIPLCIQAQLPGYKSSPLVYAWQNVGPQGFTPELTDFLNIKFNPVTGEPWVAFHDSADNYAASVMKFTGHAWVYVGTHGFTAGEADFINLAFNSLGEPYVVFQDWDNDASTSVMKFNGTSWVHVGSAGFTDGYSTAQSIAINATGQPYITWQRSGFYADLVVMKFDGTGWVNVGTTNCKTEQLNTTIAFNKDNVPFVAYLDDNAQPVVIKYDGTNWIPLGPVGGETGTFALYPAFAFDPISGWPYLVYQDGFTENGGATVARYDGTEWVFLGDPGFTDGEADYTSLAFNPYGVPYVAFQDIADSGRAAVMKYDGTKWVKVGATPLSMGGAELTQVAVSYSGSPYVVFRDLADSSKVTVVKYDSVEIGINELHTPGFSLYPNPSRDKITIETTPESTPAQLTILNLNGTPLITRLLTRPKTQIDVSALPCGIYAVQLTGDNAVRVGRLVKQ